MITVRTVRDMRVVDTDGVGEITYEASFTGEGTFIFEAFFYMSDDLEHKHLSCQTYRLTEKGVKAAADMLRYLLKQEHRTLVRAHCIIYM